MYSELLPVIIAALLLFVTLLAVKNKAMFTLGVRNLARRPKHTAIVVTAILISTAIISGSLVASNSLNYAVVKATYDALGNVDEIITMNGQPFNVSVYEKLAADPYIANNTKGLSPSLYGQVPSVDDVTSGITSTQVTLVGLNFSADAQFGEFTLLNNTQTNANNLRGGEALINNKLAQDLNAHEGDKLTIYYGGNESSLKAYTFVVKYIAKDEGKALYGLSKNIFVTLDAAQVVFQNEDQINEIRISNLGTAESGFAKSNDVSGFAAKTLSDSPERFDVKAVKQDMLATTQQEGALFSNLLTVFAVFAVVASGTLIVNVFVTLGEERKSELGMARAIGMKRRHLVLLFLFEGTIAAFLAAALGSVLGVGIGACILSVLNVAFSGENLVGTSLVLHYDLSDLVTAFLVGVLIAMLTMTLSAFKISRLSIAGAIHNTEHSVSKSQRPIGSILVGIALVAFGLAAYTTSTDIIVVDVIAPILVIAGLALIVKQLVSRRMALTTSGMLLITYAAYNAVANPASFGDLASTLVFAALGILLLIGALLVVLANASIWLRGVAKLLGRVKGVQSSLKLAIAYSLQEKYQFRMTVIIVSVVIFLVVLASVAAAVYNPDIEKQTGGYDIRVTTTTPLTNLTMFQVQSLTPGQSRTAPGAL
ncbi:MAG: FtsX-like permease family protein, partial [Euryarchaeota archaeon]